MRVSTVNNNHKQNRYLNAAKNGALTTAGLLTVSNTITMLTKPSEITNAIKKSGSKSTYLKNYMFSLAILSAIGGVFNAAVTFIADKISPNKNPKAAN